MLPRRLAIVPPNGIASDAKLKVDSATLVLDFAGISASPSVAPRKLISTVRLTESRMAAFKSRIAPDIPIRLPSTKPSNATAAHMTVGNKE